MSAGELGPAHEEIGEPGIGLVVDQRRAVEARRVRPVGVRHGHRCGRVPLVLPTRMHVGVHGPPEHRCRLGARRAHGHQLGVEAGRHALGLDGGSGPAHRRCAAARRGAGASAPARERRAPGDEDEVLSRERHGAHHGQAVDDEGDVDGEVVAPLGVLACPVEGVDDPDPAGTGRAGPPGPSSPSSESTASRGRASRRAAMMCSLDRRSPSRPRARGSASPMSRRSSMSTCPASVGDAGGQLVVVGRGQISHLSGVGAGRLGVRPYRKGPGPSYSR